MGDYHRIPNISHKEGTTVEPGSAVGSAIDVDKEPSKGYSFFCRVRVGLTAFRV